MVRRILLISTNRCATPDEVFPLGLAHLNAALREAGHETQWLDFNLDASGLPRALEAFQPHFVGVSLRNIDDVLIRKQETYFDLLSDLCATVHAQCSSPVIIGGSGFSIFPRELLARTGADYGIQGEGEAGLIALIETLTQGKSCEDLPGVVFRRNGAIVVNPPAPAPVRQVLDDQDWPAPITAHYLQTSGILNVQTQRGCGFRCCYCTYPVIEGRQNRRRPPEVVADEFERLARLGSRYVFIVDSVFNFSNQHAAEVCEALVRRKVKLSWGCFLRPQGLTPDLMRLMARAGLAHIEFGTDSFCDEVLASYQKAFTFDDILDSSEVARKAGVDYCHFLIAGGPGETRETMRTGFENSKRLNGAVIMAVVGMRIYPGTQLHERAIAERVIQPDTDLLKPVYYLAPGLTVEGLFTQLQEFARLSPNWIVGDPDPAYTKLVERLRQRGVVGPLWGYFAMIQRLWAPGATMGGKS